MKRLFIPLLGFVLSAGLSAAQAETVWNLATAYKDNNFHTQNIARFVEEVEEHSGGKLKMTMHTGASLLKMPEIKRGVQTGQVQVGEILLSAYGKEDPFFEVDGIPFLSQGQMTAWEVYELTLPFIRAKLEKQRLMPLFSVPWPGQGLYSSAASDLYKRQLMIHPRASALAAACITAACVSASRALKASALTITMFLLFMALTS